MQLKQKYCLLKTRKMMEKCTQSVNQQDFSNSVFLKHQAEY